MAKTNNQTLVGLGALIIIGVAYFGVYPVLKNLKSLNLEVAVKTEEAKALQDKVNALKQIQTDMKAKASEVQKLEVALPGSAKTEEIYFAIESIAVGSGVSLDNIAPNSASGTGSGSDASVMVTVSGDFNKITDFVSNVNKNLRPARLNNLTFTSVKAGDNSEKLSATFDLGFLVALSPTSAAPPTSPAAN